MFSILFFLFWCQTNLHWLFTLLFCFAYFHMWTNRNHERAQTGVMPYKCTACDKSFRYKVSQRTHKCTAQPPGMVIRQAGDLIQKLIKQNAMTSAMAVTAGTPTPPPASVQSSAVNGDGQPFSVIDPSLAISVGHLAANHTDHFAHSVQTLDEFVEESYKRLGFEATIESSAKDHRTATEAFMTALDEIQIPSPSERLQNLCLYSPSASSSPAMAVTMDATPAATIISTPPLSVTALPPPPPPSSAPIVIGNSTALSPATDDLFAQTLETINEDTFKQLLYGNIDDLNSLI